MKMERLPMGWIENPNPASWLDAEKYVCDLVNGRLTESQCSYDVLSASGTRLEVKFSRLATPNRGSALKRWSFSRLLGCRDAGSYDRLILCGVRDERYLDQYKDGANSPFVFFDLPREEVSKVTLENRYLKQHSVYLPTDFHLLRRGRHGVFPSWYHVSEKELMKRYGRNAKVNEKPSTPNPTRPIVVSISTGAEARERFDALKARLPGPQHGKAKELFLKLLELGEKNL